MAKTLTGPELAFLQEFVREVWLVCKYDDYGMTGTLDSLALNAGEILGLSEAEMEHLDDE